MVRILEEAVLVYFDVLYKHLSGGDEETRKTLSRDNGSPGQESNLGSPQRELWFPTTEPQIWAISNKWEVNMLFHVQPHNLH
jgi:hypothetical protein